MPIEKVLARGPINADTQLTTQDVGDLLHLDGLTIALWTNKGLLPATKTLGGHRRIRAGDLAALIKARGLPVPAPLRHLVRPIVVFVDDYDLELRVFQRQMKPYADQVDARTVNNGVDALLMIGELKPTLVILDVIMPGLDGVEVCRRLRANPSTKSTKILVVSADLKEETAQRALAAGADRALEKPFGAEVVLEMVVLQATAAVAQP